MTRLENKETEWRIVPNESWKPVVAEYKERIAQIRLLDPSCHTFSDKTFSDVDTKAPFSPSVDNKTISILNRLRLFGASTTFVAIIVAQTICDLWESGMFILIPLNIRFLFESWARVHFAKDIINKLANTQDIDKAEERVERLTFGTRYEITLPWGGKSKDIKPIHINDCLRTLKDVYPAYQATYDFLSESSHPSFFENSYFMLAGPPLANWNNQSFKESMKPKLEKCFLIFETCIAGIIKDSSNLTSAYATVYDTLSNEVNPRESVNPGRPFVIK